MKDKYIIYSITLLFFGITLFLSGYIIMDYKDKREDSEKRVKELVSYAEMTKQENDVIAAKRALLDVKEKSLKEELLEIVDNLYIDIYKENVKESYNSLLKKIEDSLNLEELLKVKSEIETIIYDDVKEPLIEYIDLINKKIEDKKREEEEELKKNTYNYMQQKDSEKVISTVPSDVTVLETLYGKVTAFTPYCSDGCNGYVASGMFVGDGNIYYNDKEYGKVRIVAADKSYPFGTIVRIKNLWYFGEDVYAIVLDRGGAIGKNKRALFDLLFALEDSANTFGVENAEVDVLRLGY